MGVLEGWGRLYHVIYPLVFRLRLRLRPDRSLSASVFALRATTRQDDPTRRESRRASNPALFRLRRTVGNPPADFTLDAWTLKPSDFCSVGVKNVKNVVISFFYLK
jgi:hypothetical protein